MAIFEYTCSECNTHFEYFHKNSEDAASCIKCGSKNLRKQFSTFSVNTATSKTGSMPDCSEIPGMCGSGMCNPGTCGMAHNH